MTGDEVWKEQTWPDELYGNLKITGKCLSIRLLRIFPGPLHTPLDCKLIRTTLFEAPPYEALSYTWGSSLQRRSVYIDGIHVLISENLDAALRYLRPETGKPRTVWIDALCINQHDVAERSEQVQEMGEIYSSAERVVIYLGPLTPEQELLADTNRLLTDVVTPTENPAQHKDWHKRSIATLKALKTVLNAPWWKRVWVVQEVARAQRDPLIMLGRGRSVTLSELARYAGKGNHGLDLHWLNTLVEIRNRTRIPPRMRALGSEDSLQQQSRVRMAEDLHYLLDATRAFDSTDPRDKIFAIWTLARGSHAHRLKPDYSKTMSTVYKAITMELIQSLGNLSLLERRWGRPKVGLASWVPDYSVEPLPVFPTPEPLKPRVAHRNLVDQNQFQQSASIGLFQDIPPGYTLLKTEIVVLDKVSRVLSIEPYIRTFEQKAREARALASQSIAIDHPKHLLAMIRAHGKDDPTSNAVLEPDQRKFDKLKQELQKIDAIGARRHELERQEEPFLPLVLKVAKWLLTLPKAKVAQGDQKNTSQMSSQDAWTMISQFCKEDISDTRNEVLENLTFLSEDGLPQLYHYFHRSHKDIATGMSKHHLNETCNLLSSQESPQSMRQGKIHRMLEQYNRIYLDALDPSVSSNALPHRQARSDKIKTELPRKTNELIDSIDQFVQEQMPFKKNPSTLGSEGESHPHPAKLVLFETSRGLRGFSSPDLRNGDHIVLLKGMSSIGVVRTDLEASDVTEHTSDGVVGIDLQRYQGDRIGSYLGSAWLHVPESEYDLLAQLTSTPTENIWLI